MKQKTPATLHIEWTPGWVRVLNMETGAITEGTSIGQLDAALNGQRNVLVGLGRNLIFLKTLRLPKVRPEDLHRILDVQLSQLFPLPADQLTFDFMQTTDIDAEGCLTLVAAVRSEHLKQLLAELKKANISPERILPIALAAPAVANRLRLSRAVVAERGTGGLSLDVVDNGILRLSRVVSDSSDIVVEAQRTMSAARADGAPIVAEDDAGLPGATSAHVSTLRLLGDTPPINFVLAEDREREFKHHVAGRTRLAILMIVSALLLVTLVWNDRADAFNKVQGVNRTWTNTFEKLKVKQKAQADEAARLFAIKTNLDTAFKPAQPLSDISAVISDCLPVNAWLTGLSVERGKSLQIRGTAKTSGDVASFVEKLGANGRFRDVKLVFANAADIGTTPIVQFNLTADAVGNLPMPVPPKRVVKTAAHATATQTGAT